MPMDQRKFVDVEGIKTCYYEAGDGPPLVLFHGGNTGSPDAADCALAKQTLDALGAKRIIVAHTVQKAGINSVCDGLVSSGL